MSNILLKDNANLLQLFGLKLESQEVYDNTANVTARIYDEADALKDTYTLTNIANSNGDYSAVIPSTFSVEVNDIYYVKFNVVMTGGLQATLRMPLIVKNRADS